jgi:predicted nucleic acid-binding protein
LELDDCLIAATAFIENAFLATGNEKHYPMKDIKKIRVK